MLRVTYDHQIFSTQQYGGISRYFYELARRVADSSEFTATIVAPLYRNSYLAEGGVKVRGFKIPHLKNTGRVVSMFNHLIGPVSVLASRPDVIHETYYSARKTSLLKGYPSVVTVYDMIHERLSNDFHGDNTAILKREAVKRADHVICISENTRRDLVDILKIPLSRTSAIHLGFSLTHASEASDTAAPQRPFILYVGLRRGYKNFDGFLKAYASSTWLRNEFDLIAFGGGRLTFFENEYISSLGLPQHAVQHKSGNDAVLASLYKTASAFVYPSLYEGFGIPPLEAMSFNCPAICSSTSSIPEVVGDAAYFFDPGSIESMRSAMESVLGSAEIRADLVRRGAARTRLFSWDRCATETIKVYRDLAQ